MIRPTSLLSSLVLVWALATSALGAASASESALARLERTRPDAVAGLTPAVRAVLARITPAQLDQVRAGVPTSAITLADGTTLAAFIAATVQGTPFSIPWSTIDGGGAISTGGVYQVEGTIGQPDVGASSGGLYVLLGGYWGSPKTSAPPLPFADGFESGNTGAWTQSVSVP